MRHPRCTLCTAYACVAAHRTSPGACSAKKNKKEKPHAYASNCRKRVYGCRRHGEAKAKVRQVPGLRRQKQCAPSKASWRGEADTGSFVSRWTLTLEVCNAKLDKCRRINSLQPLSIDVVVRKTQLQIAVQEHAHTARPHGQRVGGHVSMFGVDKEARRCAYTFEHVLIVMISSDADTSLFLQSYDV
jgi:hypothetical protein